MSNHANSGQNEDSPAAQLPESEQEGVESIEAYDTEDGVVFYDAQNPLAWLKAGHALTLKEQV